MKQQREISGEEDVLAKDEPLEVDKVIGTFVTCNEGFRRELVALRDWIKAYSLKENPPRPLNVLLAAAPGSGKSFLVKQLAAAEIHREAEFREYHVASFPLRSKGD